MNKGKVNIYTCQTCAQSIVTKDVDEGTTPFMILCEATEGCQGVMHSHFCGVDQNLPHSYEWFRPETLDGYGPEMVEHIKLGGLDLRKSEGS